MNPGMKPDYRADMAMSQRTHGPLFIEALLQCRKTPPSGCSIKQTFSDAFDVAHC
jgi:hypothetical protein